MPVAILLFWNYSHEIIDLLLFPNYAGIIGTSLMKGDLEIVQTKQTFTEIHIVCVTILSPAHSVVCHQLGFGDAISAIGYFGSGSSFMPIWLDDVQCTNGDSYLSECRHNGWGYNDYSHSEDAGVACTGTGLLKHFCF